MVLCILHETSNISRICLDTPRGAFTEVQEMEKSSLSLNTYEPYLNLYSLSLFNNMINTKIMNRYMTLIVKKALGKQEFPIFSSNSPFKVDP